jgi:hypothetical protein
MRARNPGDFTCQRQQQFPEFGLKKAAKRWSEDSRIYAVCHSQNKLAHTRTWHASSTCVCMSLSFTVWQQISRFSFPVSLFLNFNWTSFTHYRKQMMHQQFTGKSLSFFFADASGQVTRCKCNNFSASRAKGLLLFPVIHVRITWLMTRAVSCIGKKAVNLKGKRLKGNRQQKRSDMQIRPTESTTKQSSPGEGIGFQRKKVFPRILAILFSHMPSCCGNRCHKGTN